MRTALPPPAYERENSATREDGSVLPSGPSSLRAAALADEDAAAHRSQELIVLRAMLHLEALKRDVQIDFLYCSHVRVASRANRSYKDVTSTRGKTDGGRRWAWPYPACLCFLTAVPLSFVRGRDLNRNMTDATRPPAPSDRECTCALLARAGNRIRTGSLSWSSGSRSILATSRSRRLQNMSSRSFARLYAKTRGRTPAKGLKQYASARPGSRDRSTRTPERVRLSFSCCRPLD